MRILGIDPGIQITGYSVIEADGEDYQIITTGSIQTSKDDRCSKRLLEISNDIKTICETYKPDIASIEQLFYFKNQKTIIPVAQARGVILSALEECNIKIYEYTPIVVKQVVTGSGRADKKFVQMMVKQIVNLDTNVKLDDTIDSVAIAICCNRSEVF